MPLPLALAAAFALGLLPFAGQLALAWLKPHRSAPLHARGWDRVGILEKMIDILRIALDKGRVRENAVVRALDVVLLVLDMIEEEHPDLAPRIAKAKEHAREIMAEARAHARAMTGEGQ